MNYVFKNRVFNFTLVIIIFFLYFQFDGRIKKVENLVSNQIEAVNQKIYDQNFSSSLPVVLQWNDIHWVDILPKNLQCQKKCFFTKTMRYENFADVILFYFGNGALKEIPKSDQRKRMNVMITFEPPTLGHYFTNIRSDFFNFTVTYRSDSDLPMPYDCLKELDKNDTDKWSDEEVDKAISNKNNMALYLVSHCSTDSKRESIIEKIKKYINITQFGECNNNQCPRDEECEKRAISK